MKRVVENRLKVLGEEFVQREVKLFYGLFKSEYSLETIVDDFKYAKYR